MEINRSTISLLENEKQIPSLDILQKFCEKMSIGIDTYFTQENDDPIVMMMGSLKEVDKPKLLDVLERIKIRQKYIAIGKRCSQ